MDVCNGICSVPTGYTSRCQQQYVQKRLVALQGNGNQLYADIFWFPHGCSCEIIANYWKNGLNESWNREEFKTIAFSYENVILQNLREGRNYLVNLSFQSGEWPW